MPRAYDQDERSRYDERPEYCPICGNAVEFVRAVHGIESCSPDCARKLRTRRREEHRKRPQPPPAIDLNRPYVLNLDCEQMNLISKLIRTRLGVIRTEFKSFGDMLGSRRWREVVVLVQLSMMIEPISRIGVCRTSGTKPPGAFSCSGNTLPEA